MNEEEYLNKLVNDFGKINNYSIGEKKEFFEMLKFLLALNENDGSHEDIIKLITKKS